MTLALSQQAAINAVGRSGAGAQLIPRLMTDGRYAISDATLTNPIHALAHRYLRTGATITLAPGDLVSTSRMLIELDGKTFYDWSPQRAWSINSPSAGLFRFEARHNDFVDAGDPANENRRSEIVPETVSYGAGDLWAAWSTVVVSMSETSRLGLIHQWKGLDTTVKRSPVFGVEVYQGQLRVWTRSDASSATVVHYTTDAPDSGVQTDFVVRGTLGSSGHLDVWIDGTHVVDVDTPFGYYNDPGDLARPQLGIYSGNVATADVVYHGNIEFGVDDLSARVLSTPSLPVPTGGWA